MDYKFENLKNSDKLRVTLEGLPASEIRRVAENLKITPDMLVKSLVVTGLKDRYGIVVE